MTDIETKILEKIKEGLPNVPKDKLDYLIGWSEGFAAGAARNEQQKAG